jgi:hypothetical protein
MKRTLSLPLSASSMQLQEDAGIACLAEPMITEEHHGDVAHIHDGYGYCTISGCPCQSYMGQGDLCTNCGHQYVMHN